MGWTVASLLIRYWLDLPWHKKMLAAGAIGAPAAALLRWLT